MIEENEFVFSFGKYKGEFYGDVREIDPWYIKWCNDSIEWFVLSDDECDYIESMCAIEKPSDPLDWR